METIMTTNVHSGSATIFQFPARGRFALSGRAEASQPATNLLTAPRAANVAFGSSWYHEEAIREAELAHKN
jgi:hypothetical protein